MCALFLGLDVGTQGTKALVYDAHQRRIVSRGQHTYGIISSRPGQAEQSPSTWVQGVISATKQAVQGVSREQIKAVAVSGQQHGLVVLDSAGEVVRDAKLWCDTETAPQAEKLSAMFNTTIVPGFTAPKILWLKENEPENFECADAMLLPHDYINFWLTGCKAMEAGDASGTALFNTAARAWDKEAMAAVDPRLPSLFPRLIGPNEVLGTVTEEAAAQLGLSAGVTVAPGSGDNMMSALGAGAVKDGQMVVSLGTSGTIFGRSPRPILDPTGAVAPFCDATGAWLPLLCTLNCTGPLEEVRTAWQLSHEQLTELAAAEPPGCRGVNFLPYLVGERTPNWPKATGTIMGLQPGLLRPGLLYRAAMEGTTFGLLAGLRRMQELGLEPWELRVVGGGSKNPLWRQIIADAFQLPLRVPLEPESAALGAALQAAAVYSGVPVGEYVQQHEPPLADEVAQPDPAKAAAYREAFERHQQLSMRLFGS